MAVPVPPVAASGPASAGGSGSGGDFAYFEEYVLSGGTFTASTNWAAQFLTAGTFTGGRRTLGGELSVAGEVRGIGTVATTAVTGAISADFTTVTSAGATTQTLPAGVAGKQYTIKNADLVGTGVVTLAATAGNIDGVATQTINALVALVVEWDGSNWWVV